jgi:hypothetical protein
MPLAWGNWLGGGYSKQVVTVSSGPVSYQLFAASSAAGASTGPPFGSFLVGPSVTDCEEAAVATGIRTSTRWPTQLST